MQANISKSESVRVRATNFSKEEELCLVKIISKYKNVIECKSSNVITPGQREEAWQKILREFNSCNTARTLNQLKSKYDNLKTATRKYAGNLKRNLYGTGGGPPTEAKNVIYEEMIEILNKKTVEGLSNPYDDDMAVTIEEICYDNVYSPSTSSQNIIIEYQETEKENIPSSVNVDVADTLATDHEYTQNTSSHTWEFYTPKMLKEPKHKKLKVKNKASQQRVEEKTLYSLKQKYLEQKLENLREENRRKQERHEKEMELLDIEIANKKIYLESNMT